MVKVVLYQPGWGLAVEQLVADVVLEEDPGGRPPTRRHEAPERPVSREEPLAGHGLPAGQHQALLGLAPGTPAGTPLARGNAAGLWAGHPTQDYSHRA